MEIDLEMRQIPFMAQHELELTCPRGRVPKRRYTPDLIIDNRFIVELKALKALTDEHRSQLLNYLKATGLRVGLLVNFGKPGGLEWERMVL